MGHPTVVSKFGESRAAVMDRSSSNYSKEFRKSCTRRPIIFNSRPQIIQQVSKELCTSRRIGFEKATGRVALVVACNVL